MTPNSHRPVQRAARPAAIALACLLAFLGGCREARKPAGAEPVPVLAMRVETRTLRRTLDYAGNIRAREEAAVYPKVAGKLMERVREEGARVAKGDVLAFIDRDEVGFTYEKAPVESPLDGIVGRVHADHGASVTPQTAIALVVDIEAVELLLNVPEKHIAGVSLGQAAEAVVDAWPAETFTGRVTRISPVMDLDTRTAPVEITLPNPGHRLKPGMFARVRLVLEEHPNAAVIAKEAILGKAPRTYVYVVSNQLAHSRDVRLGLRAGAECEVTEGLARGDAVVIMGQQRLRDGAAVRVEFAGADAAGDRGARVPERAP